MNTEMQFINVKKIKYFLIIVISLFSHFFEKYRKNYKICRVAMTTITLILHVPKIHLHYRFLRRGVAACMYF